MDSECCYSRVSLFSEGQEGFGKGKAWGKTIHNSQHDWLRFATLPKARKVTQQTLNRILKSGALHFYKGLRLQPKGCAIAQ